MPGGEERPTYYNVSTTQLSTVDDEMVISVNPSGVSHKKIQVASLSLNVATLNRRTSVDVGFRCTDKQAAQWLHIDEETGFSKSACASEG